MKYAWNVGSSQMVLVMIVVLGATTGVAACGSGAPKFNSKANLTGASPIESLLTVSDLKTDDFGYGMFYRGFRAGLTSALHACGVKARMLQVDPLELDLSDRIEQNIKQLRPSAVMHIKLLRRPTAVFSDEATVGEDWILELEMLDVVSKKQIWLARSMPKFDGRYISSGIKFATGIASRLRDDGVLSGCPTDVVGWPVVPPLPSCDDERRSIVTQAQGTTDMAERKRLIRTMPTCDYHR